MNKNDILLIIKNIHKLLEKPHSNVFKENVTIDVLKRKFKRTNFILIILTKVNTNDKIYT